MKVPFFFFFWTAIINNESAPPPPRSPLAETMNDVKGDFGMDPLNLTKNADKKARYELSEVQHCRLAMMAISGIATQAVINGGAFPYMG